MASTLRTARSNAAPVAPAGRGSDGAARLGPGDDTGQAAGGPGAVALGGAVDDV